MINGYIVYKHTNKLNGKSYIGITNQTMEQRWAQHISIAKRGVGYQFHDAIRKYGPDNFNHEILLENLSIETAKDVEVYYINEYQTFQNGYNATPGGDGTYERTQEWCDNKSQSMKNKFENGEWQSPFSNPIIHKKTIKSRTNNGTNIFEVDNPMKNPYYIEKKLKSMPDMKGRKQWVNYITGERLQQVECPLGEGWENISFSKGISKNKGVPKPKVQCDICGKMIPVHIMKRHLRTHENN